jgi:hypothetical protein
VFKPIGADKGSVGNYPYTTGHYHRRGSDAVYVLDKECYGGNPDACFEHYAAMQTPKEANKP